MFEFLPERKSQRLHGYDYASGGAYFVTVCVEGRRCLFGQVVGGEVVLNDVGKAVAISWEDMARKNQFIKLDAWIVMPNHLHGILAFQDVPGEATVFVGRPSVNVSGKEDLVRVKRKSLGRVIGSFKTVTTRKVNAGNGMSGTTLWQRGYHDRVIRNEKELKKIREYIQNNPVNWELDRENPAFVEGKR